MEESRKENIFAVFYKLVSRLQYSKFQLLIMIFLQVLHTINTIYFSVLIGETMEKVSMGAFNFTELILPFVIVAFVMLIVGFCLELLKGRFGTFAHYQMSSITFGNILKTEHSWSQDQRTGDIINRTGESLNYSVNLVTKSIPNLLFTFISIGLMLAYLLTNNWKLTILYFLLYPLVFYMQNAFSRPISDSLNRRFKASAELNNVSVDSLRNHSTVKSYELEVTMWEEFKKRGRKLQTYFNKFTWTKSITCFIGEVFAVLPTVAVGLGAIYLLSNEMLEFASFLSFMLVMFNLNSPLQMFGRNMAEVRGDVAGANRLLEIWNAPQEDRTQPYVQPAVTDKAIVFENVSFSYNQKNLVLDNISLHVLKGEHVALVGESGCGKSTIIRLLAGLYEGYSGNIYVLGNSLRSWNPAEMRKNMSFVSQNSDIFSVSLFDNIAWAGENVTVEEVKKSCEDAGILEFITTLPDGLETMAGEGGTQLSGGQRQRIAIARALVRNAEMLFLDEATSALDATTEVEVQEKLEAIIKGKTVVTVAHRLSSIKNADRILVMVKGRIEEEGTHVELMGKRGVYFDLYQSQLDEVKDEHR
ncbi:ABC transporter ATP-binding protein [Paenibacillus lautus]|uniref:ABC transporter ATP-binding protein n=1 Tax=Paenibacillus lautus TaxID=1401 RepID=UPI003D282E82